MVALPFSLPCFCAFCSQNHGWSLISLSVVLTMRLKSGHLPLVLICWMGTMFMSIATTNMGMMKSCGKLLTTVQMSTHYALQGMFEEIIRVTHSPVLAIWLLRLKATSSYHSYPKAHQSIAELFLQLAQWSLSGRNHAWDVL